MRSYEKYNRFFPLFGSVILVRQDTDLFIWCVSADLASEAYVWKSSYKGKLGEDDKFFIFNKYSLVDF